MKPKYSIPLLLAVLLGAAALVASPTTRPEIPKRDGSAPARIRDVVRIVYATGAAEAYREGIGWFAPRHGASLAAGDSARTLGEGTLQMESAGRRFQVSGNATTGLRGGPGERAGAVDAVALVGGRLRAEGDGGRELVVETPHGKVSAWEAVLSVDLSRDGSLRVAAHEGTVTVTSGGATERLAAGEALALSDSVLRRFAAAEMTRPEDASATPRPHTEPVRGTEIREVTHLNPDVYLGVELEVAGDRRGDSLSIDTARIRHIRVRSNAWDALQAERKVELLNDTFRFLKQRYPNVTHSVVLRFDDDRAALSLRYPEGLRGS